MSSRQPVIAISKEKAIQLHTDMYELHFDIEVLAWGCDQLWHHQFSSDTDMEKLSHFPLSVLRLLSLRTGKLAALTEDFSRENAI